MWHRVYDIIFSLRLPPPRTRNRFLWISFMKCPNYVWGMLEMLCRLPCCFGDRVPFPEDNALKLAIEETRVENLVDFIFFSGRELDWWWRRESTGVLRYGDLQKGRHGIHYEYNSGMVALTVEYECIMVVFTLSLWTVLVLGYLCK